MTAAEALCRALEASGCAYVFGLPGSQSAGLWVALSRSEIRTVVPSHELAASFMAVGHARASGRPAVLATIPGPGFTYALSGIAEARLDSIPLVHVVDGPADVPGKKFRLQEIDQDAMAAPLVKRIVRVDDADAIAGSVAAAFATAAGGEPGPVLLTFRPGLLRGPAGSPPPPPGLASVPAPRLDSVAAVADRVDRAARPLMLLGQGAADAGPAVERLADRVGAIIVTTTSARGTVPEDRPRVIVIDGRAPDAVNALIEDSDLVLVLGAKLTHNGALGFRLRLDPVRTVRVDASAEVVGANYPAGAEIVADVPALLARLDARAPSAAAAVPRGRDAESCASWRSRIESALDDARPEPIVRGADPPTPRSFFERLREVLPREAVLVVDSGSHQMLARRYFRVLGPRGFLVPADFQSMGFGLPASIGARLARPDRPCVALIGDGGLAMTAMELATAARLRLPLPVVVFRDASFGLIRDQQIAAYGVTHGVDLPAIDHAALARATGVRFLRAADGNAAEAVRSALTAAGPTLIEVPVEESPAQRRLRRVSRAKAVVRRIVGR